MYNKFKNQNESYSDYTARVEREKENISLSMVFYTDKPRAMKKPPVP